MRASEFNSLVDLPRFYETMGLGEGYDPTSLGGDASDLFAEEAKNGHPRSSDKKINTDAISDGQLLVEFFEFYGYTFDNERLAIDIRHADEHKRPAPFREREEFVLEA